MKKTKRKSLELIKSNVARLNDLYVITAGNGDNNTGNNTETEPTTDPGVVMKCIEKSKKKVPVIVGDTDIDNG